MDDREVDEAREDVADEATPETDTEAVEQRTDDYDGIVRRLDEIMDMVRDRFDAIDRALEALGVATVEGTDAGDVIDDIGEDAADAVDAILGFDALDLL